MRTGCKRRQVSLGTLWDELWDLDLEAKMKERVQFCLDRRCRETAKIPPQTTQPKGAKRTRSLHRIVVVATQGQWQAALSPLIRPTSVSKMSKKGRDLQTWHPPHSLYSKHRVGALAFARTVQ